MIENPPPIPDGPDVYGNFLRWTRDQIISLGRAQDVANVGGGRTQRGSYVMSGIGSPAVAVTSGRLDQVVFAKGNRETIDDGHGHTYTNNRKQVYGVAAGYIYALSSNGTITKSKRFAFGWGDSTLVYDSAHDKLIAGFWNEERGNDEGESEGRISFGSDGAVIGNTLTSASANWNSTYDVVGSPVYLGSDFSRKVTSITDSTHLVFSGTAMASASGVAWTVGPMQKGLYKINPDTLAVEQYSVIFTPAVSGFDPFTTNTGISNGPRSLLIYNGALYVYYIGIYPGGTFQRGSLLKVDLSSLTLISSQALGAPFSPFCILAIDEEDTADGAPSKGMIWGSNTANRSLDFVDLPTFAISNEIDTSPLFTEAGSGVVGTASVPLDGSVFTIVSGVDPGYYITKYKSGCCQLLQNDATDAGKYFVDTFQTATQPFRCVMGTGLGSGAYFSTQAAAVDGYAADGNYTIATSVIVPLPGPGVIGGSSGTGFGDGQWISGHSYPVDATVYVPSPEYIWRSMTSSGSASLVDPGSYSNWNGATAYTAGDVAAAVPLGSLGFVIYRAIVDNTDRNPTFNFDKWEAVWVQHIRVVEPYTYDIIQQTVYTGAAKKFAPYGICFVPQLKFIYAVSRSSRLAFFYTQPGTYVSTADLGIIDLEDPTNFIESLQDITPIPTLGCFPYNCRFNATEKLIYIPGYKNNKIIVFDPFTQKVVGTVDNIESCFDVIFEPSPGTRKWAVCHGVKGLVPFSFTRPS